MIGIVSITPDAGAVRIALLSHHWAEFQAVRSSEDWAGLAGLGYRYVPVDRAFLKECGGRTASATAGAAPVDRETRHALCQAALDHLTTVTEIGMYPQSVAQLARRGLRWGGRCFTPGDVITRLGEAP
jgi:hypothetical protein